jgi:hypothetical protein
LSQQKVMPTNLALTPLSLPNNLSLTLMGITAYTASKWLLLVILAKLGTPAMVSQYTLAIAICMGVMSFTGFFYLCLYFCRLITW